MATPRPSRLATLEYTGTARYFLTMCCQNRRRWFEQAAVVEACRLELLRTSERHQFAVSAYVFMPDHLHALVEGVSENADLRRFVYVFRRYTTTATKLTCRQGLWQDGYHERVLRQSEETQKVIDYILNNPIRAGLVDQAVDYPFSWSCTYDELRPRA